MSGSVPELGAVFWPVGPGDSTTVVVTQDVLMQVDLNHRTKSEDDDNPEVPVVDLLVPVLPEGPGGRPYLAAFVLTHADQDHCSGFRKLVEEATIGELWATPRMWREYLDTPGGAEAVRGRCRVPRRGQAPGRGHQGGFRCGQGPRVR